MQLHHWLLRRTSGKLAHSAAVLSGVTCFGLCFVVSLDGQSAGWWAGGGQVRVSRLVSCLRSQGTLNMAALMRPILFAAVIIGCSHLTSFPPLVPA